VNRIAGWSAVAARNGPRPARLRPVSRRLRIAASLGALIALSAAAVTGPAAATAHAGARPATTAPAGTGSPPNAASTPALWPTLAPFHHLVIANVENASPAEVLAATTLEGAYNQRQRPDRIYLVQRPTDQAWLTSGALRGERESELATSGSGPGAVLGALLARYGPAIRGAIVTNPGDPDTINLATTMAGIDDAMVADPSQVPLLQHYGIPVLYSFADQSFTGPAAAYQWGADHLLPRTTGQDLVLLSPNVAGGLRDYAVATRSFVFFLTSTDGSQAPLMNQIITARPPGTPILGYIANESADVADLSSLGDFLNASDYLDNESDWSATPSPPGLRQPPPQGLRADARTVYVSFLVSDGDNAGYAQNRMFDLWHQPDFGTVPEGWTMAPGMVDFAPAMIEWYYRHRPANSEFVAGPSGIGYATAETGASLGTFAELSGAFMRRDSMSTVDYWGTPSALPGYAARSGIPSISYAGPLAYTQQGATAVLGQSSGYTDPASAVLDTLEQDVVTEMASGQPIFLEPLVDAWNLDSRDVLAIAQALTRWGATQGEHLVFLTPSELAATERAYRGHAGSHLPPLNAEAVPGQALLRLPPAGQLQGYVTPTLTGPNLVANPSGASGATGWYATAGQLSSGSYAGGPALTWTLGQTLPSQEWAHTYPAVTNGDRYVFSVQVAGSGQVFLDVWTGSADLQTPAVQLGAGFQTLTWSAAIPAGAPGGQSGAAPQLQVREDGAGPVTVQVRDATVRLASG
jgi:GxGYxYP putative glycoside hydrolase C-terminal domain/GxGYxYP third domain/GxGYxYP_N second domain